MNIYISKKPKKTFFKEKEQGQSLEQGPSRLQGPSFCWASDLVVCNLGWESRSLSAGVKVSGNIFSQNLISIFSYLLVLH